MHLFSAGGNLNEKTIDAHKLDEAVTDVSVRSVRSPLVDAAVVAVCCVDIVSELSKAFP